MLNDDFAVHGKLYRHCQRCFVLFNIEKHLFCSIIYFIHVFPLRIKFCTVNNY